jgi:hypothetical protein
LLEAHRVGRARTYGKNCGKILNHNSFTSSPAGNDHNNVTGMDETTLLPSVYAMVNAGFLNFVIINGGYISF